ncbi:acetyltransferase [Shewanella algae]|nr:acetyltransferase [Shewanella algae]
MLSSFTCPKNADVESFLHNKAIDFERRDAARTYLLVSQNGDILAYFSLSFKELQLNGTSLSGAQVKKLDGFSKRAERVKAYLIGQIGKNYSVVPNPINLECILDEVYMVIDEARALLGGRAIILECENTRRLIELYQTQGFKLIHTTSNEKGLVTMYTVVSG